jgi:cysteine synthase
VKVPPVSIVDANHFFNLAQNHSADHQAYFTNQFENLDNAKVHELTTGPEIYRQTNGLLDCFLCGAGTGGTLAGVSKYLKQKNPNIQVVLADPEGSGLFNKVKYGVLFTSQEKEGHRLKNPFDTVVEGVGLNRSTANFSAATIDEAFKVSDQEVLHMAHYLIENEGLFVGGSTAMNLVAAVKQGRNR